MKMVKMITCQYNTTYTIPVEGIDQSSEGKGVGGARGGVVGVKGWEGQEEG